MEEYLLFRNFFSVIDAITLDYDHLLWDERFLPAANLYILIGLFLKVFSIELIVDCFAFNSNIFTQFYEYNIIFNDFLKYSFNCDLDELIENIQYVSMFYNISFSCKNPFNAENKQYLVK